MILIPKYKLGDTVILNRRWFLFFREYVLCEIVFGRFDEMEQEWSYCLRVGNQRKRFMMTESELEENLIQPL